MSKKKKKTNHGHKPASFLDICAAKKQAQEKAIELTWSIFFTVLCDKEGYEIEDLQRVWKECEDLSDSIAKGYCTVKDLRQILKEEQGACLK